MTIESLPFRRRFALAFYITGMKVVAWTVAKISGDMRGLLPDLFNTAKDFIQPLRVKAVEHGGAREFQQFEGMLQQLATSIRPDSQWVHHEAQWGEYRVVVMPRVIDSNTGVVIGPKESNPNLGAVVTNDGEPPNCDPPALDFILNGPAILGKVDAEFTDSKPETA